MEKIKRKIRLFFVYYGRLFIYVIGGILLLILLIQTLNNIVIEKNIKESQIVIEKEKKKIEEENEIEYISKFIDYCNKGEIEEAYNMLSNKCKEKYKTIEDFKNNYIEKVFDVYICDYTVTKSNNTYEAILIQDMLITGKSDSIKTQVYKLELILEPKIYIISK